MRAPFAIALLGAAIALVPPVPADTLADEKDGATITVRVLEVPEFPDEPSACPEGWWPEIITLFHHRKNKVVGFADQCDTFIGDDTHPIYAIEGTFHLKGGTIGYTGTATFSLDFTTITYDVVMTGGTRRYRGAEGTVRGGGDPGFLTGAPDVTLVFAFEDDDCGDDDDDD